MGGDGQREAEKMMLSVLGVTLALMLAASAIQRVIGDAGASIVSRVMGLILAAVSVETVLSGLRTYFSL